MGRSETWRNQRERRFHLQPAQVSQIAARLAAELPVVSYAPGSVLTFVATTYLDSKDRAYLAMAERSEGLLSLKVRVREYITMHGDGDATRLTYSPTCFLERKERVGLVRVKQRIELPKAHVEEVLRQERALTGDSSVVKALKVEIDARPLEPVLVSGYQRRVFGSDHGLRVTMDEQLGFHAPPEGLYRGASALTPEVLGEPAGRGPAHILEVKEGAGADTPQWLSDLLDDLESADQFSKFREGIRCLASTGAAGQVRRLG